MADEYRENPGLSEGHDGENIGRISTPMDDDAIADSNGHHPQDESTDEGLSYEEQLNFAGVDPDEEGELVTTEDLLDGPSTAKERGAENSPLTRTGLVAAGLGGFVFLIWVLSGFFGGEEPVVQEPEDPLPDETSSPFDESDELKAELALREQDEAQEQQPRAARVERNPNTQEPEPEASETPQTRVVSTRPTPPPPTPARAAPTPPPSAPATLPPPLPATEIEEVDPLEEWARLARIGSNGSEVALMPEPEFAPPGPTTEGSVPTANGNLPVPNVALSTVNPQAVRPQAQPQFPFPSATIGDNPVPLPGEQPSQFAQTPTAVAPQSEFFAGPTGPIGSDRSRGQLIAATPGTQGILNREPVPVQPATPNTVNQTRLRQVAIGSSATGQVMVPVVYAGGNVQARGRFAVQLTEPLLDINGEVALAEGTIFITQITEALNSNILRQQVVAIVYEDATGQVRQEAVEPEVLLVRGNGNEPLIANAESAGGQTFRQDLLVGAFSALGNIGSVINAPDAVTTATSGTSGGSSSSTTSTTVTTGDDDNIVAAALEGFFTPISERAAERFDEQNQDTARPYLIVEAGQSISIFVNGLLEVVR